MPVFAAIQPRRADQELLDVTVVLLPVVLQSLALELPLLFQATHVFNAVLWNDVDIWIAGDLLEYRRKRGGDNFLFKEVGGKQTCLVCTMLPPVVLGYFVE